MCRHGMFHLITSIFSYFCIHLTMQIIIIFAIFLNWPRPSLSEQLFTNRRVFINEVIKLVLCRFG